jgi:hypothetical protein
MFTLPNFQKKTSGLQTLIDDLELHIRRIGPAHQDYSKFTKELAALYTMKKGESRPRVDPNVLLQAGVSLVAVLAILRSEEFNVITSKALSFVKFK